MSEVKVNKISPRSGTDVTLGDSGDTFTIPSGATINNQGTAVNFGATGSASWVTTVKTSTFTAVAGEGYFINTTGGVVSVNLPAGTAGAVVAVKDYAGTFDTNAVTLVQNGSDKIGGSTTNATLEVEGIAVTLVFIDSTQGWLITDSGLQSEAPTAAYITATGGTPTTSPCGDYKIHTFTGPGTFTICSVGNACGSNTVDYLVVAGGGGGGLGTASGAGGGGAGGVRFFTETAIPGAPAAPRNNFPSGTVATISATGFPITVGAGAPARPNTKPPASTGNSGSPSIFSNITSAGGGGGGTESPSAPSYTGASGGSGGGGGYHCNSTGAGTGNTPPTTPAQGSNGGNFGGPSPGCRMGGGGGGFMQVGYNGGNPGTGPTRGNGGDGGGFPTAIVGTAGESSGSHYYFGGGGAGQSQNQPGGDAGIGGKGGGGDGGQSGGPGSQTATSGAVNTGGGGGGGYNCAAIGAGGSGIVIIRYKFQN